MLEVGGRALTPQRIFCVGRNYAEHAKEMGGTPPAEPVIFMKPATSLVAEGQALTLPRGLGSVHHEMELVAILGSAGRDIAPAAALRHVAGLSLGIDLTLRDLQTKLRQAGEPWELSKAFDGSAALGRFTPWPARFDVQALEMHCSVDGASRQRGNTRDMIFPLAAIISFLSRSWRLLPGDLIYTGTPAGVGPLKPGECIEIACPELGSFRWRCA